jgi:BexC/CtrB/KpsE family polysaccharide export inner-membrane protein
VLKRLKISDPLFFAAVILPTTLSALYYGLVASDVYISESRFVVRSSDKPAMSALGAVLSVGGISTSGDKNYAVVDYARSRDALRDANGDGAVTAAYTSDAISTLDRFGGLLRGKTFEHLYEYYSGKVSVEFDTGTQVTRLTVSAFSPRDAQLINQRLIEQSEQLVNRLNDRARSDTVRLATQEVDEAKRRAQTAAIALARFRDDRRLLDPEKEATVRLQMVSKLQDELIASRTQLAQIQRFAPDNPQIPALQTKIATLSSEIAQQTGKIAGAPGSLSGESVRYQSLRIDAEVADKQLAAALAGLQDATSDARRKQAYVERIAGPNLPDYPLEPHRWKAILATLIMGMIAWGVLRTLIAGVREHHD